MSLFSFLGKKKQRPVVLHFVTWYPTRENHVEGIFIQRQIELLALDKRFQHVVVRKNSKPVSVFEHLKILAGFFEKEEIGAMPVISLPEQSGVYQIYFWRHRPTIECSVLNRLLQRYQPDLVHLHVVYGFAKEALYLKKVKKVPFIVSEHMGPFPFEWLHDKEAVVTQPIKEASAVIAVSTAQAKQIDAFTGVKADVIPNVVDEAAFFFEERNSNNAIRKRFHLVFVGIYTKAKGVDYLLHVFPHFLQSHPDSILHLVGAATSERRTELNALSAKKGIEKNIQFHGSLSATDLGELHQRCDFYVCGSEWESFGLSILEALFTGLPVLSTNCGGVTDFITKENGLLIENDQQESTLLNGLLQMAEQLPSYNRKSIARNVREKFSNKVIQEGYLNIYQKIIQPVDSVTTG